MSAGKGGGLKRRSASRDPYKVIHMIFEGRITEPNYIDCFVRSRKKKIAVPGTLIRGAGEPKTIVGKCIDLKTQIQSESRSVRVGVTDEIWAIFDVDSHDHLMEAVELARANGIPCAISNPCIEVWGFMHAQRLDRPLSRHEAQRGLKEIIPKYHHDRNPVFDWNWCSDKVEIAARNAVLGRAARQAENSNFPRDVPSTNFDRLLSEFDEEIKAISILKTRSEW